VGTKKLLHFRIARAKLLSVQQSRMSRKTFSHLPLVTTVDNECAQYSVAIEELDRTSSTRGHCKKKVDETKCFVESRNSWFPWKVHLLEDVEVCCRPCPHPLSSLCQHLQGQQFGIVGLPMRKQAMDALLSLFVQRIVMLAYNDSMEGKSILAATR